MFRAMAWIVLSLAFASHAMAEETYPSRPVKLVVPFPPGGPLDAPVRFIAQKLTQAWGKSVVVENQPGASGSIGTNAVARAEPDGHTVLVTVDIPLTMFPAVARQVPYDPLRDFRPVCSFMRFQNALFVNPAVGAATASELVEMARKQPGKLTFASAGIGTPAHFAGELFKIISGIELVHVPYKGAAPAMNALLAGEVDMMFGPTTTGMPHVRSGKLAALGLTGPRTSAVLPDVRPLAEQGFSGLSFVNWYGVFLPAKTPDRVAEAFGAAWKHTMDDEALRARIGLMDEQPIWQGPAEVRRLIADDLRRWSELAKRAGIQSPN